MSDELKILSVKIDMLTTIVLLLAAGIAPQMSKTAQSSIMSLIDATVKP